MTEAFMGQIIAFGGNFAIRDWHICKGDLLSTGQFGALFSIIGLYFGGDGVSTFGLPDLRGRSVVGAGQMIGGSNYPLGQQYGYEQVKIAKKHLPQENLSVNVYGSTQESSTTVDASEHGPDTNNPDGAYQATWSEDRPVYASELSSSIKPFGAVKIPELQVTATGHTTELGHGYSMENRSPYQAVNWLICTQGNYPPRP